MKTYNIYFNTESKDATYVSKFDGDTEYRLILTSPGVLSIASDNLGDLITSVQGYGGGIVNIAVGATIATTLDIVTIAPEATPIVEEPVPDDAAPADQSEAPIAETPEA